MVELSLRCRYWSVLQVIAIVVCYRGKVLSERAQGCTGSRLSLSCPETKVINVKAVVLGDSYGAGSNCYIRDNDCVHNASASHTMNVHRRCDGQSSCTVAVIQEKIPCGYFSSANNDFERITYNCTDDPRRSTSATFSRSDSTEDILRTEGTTLKIETENESSDRESSTVLQSTENFEQYITDQVENASPEYQSDNQWVLPVVMTTVCFLIVIAIIVVVFIMRRKRLLKDSAVIEMTGNDSDLRNEITTRNENEAMSLDNGSGSPIYSNDKIKQSKNKDTNVSQNYEVPNNCVASNAGPTSTEDRHIYCNVDSREPVYLVPRPRDDVYSVVKDVEEPERAGSTADASIIDNSVYSDVETREPVKAAKGSVQNNNGEAISWKESGNEAVRADEAIHQDQMKKETNSPAHKRAPDSYTKVNKTSRNVATSEPPGKVASKDKVVAIDGYPNPIYEEMSPLIPESMYANAPLLSMASRAIPTGEGSITENPYCEMKSPPVKSKDNGN